MIRRVMATAAAVASVSAAPAAAQYPGFGPGPGFVPGPGFAPAPVKVTRTYQVWVRRTSYSTPRLVFSSAAPTEAGIQARQLQLQGAIAWVKSADADPLPPVAPVVPADPPVTIQPFPLPGPGPTPPAGPPVPCDRPFQVWVKTRLDPAPRLASAHRTMEEAVAEVDQLRAYGYPAWVKTRQN